MTKLALVDGVVAALGQWMLCTTPWVVDVASRYDVPIFVENGPNDITAQKRRNVFRSYFSIADRIPVMLDFAAEQCMRRIGVLCSDTVFGQMIGDNLQTYGRSHHDMDFLRFDLPQEGAKDFTEQLRSIKDYQPDLFINGSVIAITHLIIKQAAEVGLLPDTPMMVNFVYPQRSSDFWRLFGHDRCRHHMARDALPPVLERHHQNRPMVRRWVRETVRLVPTGHRTPPLH